MDSMTAVRLDDGNDDNVLNFGDDNTPVKSAVKSRKIQKEAAVATTGTSTKKKRAPKGSGKAAAKPKQRATPPKKASSKASKSA